MSMKHLSLIAALMLAIGLGNINGQKAEPPVPAKPAHKTERPQVTVGALCPCNVIAVDGEVYLEGHLIKKGEKIDYPQDVRFGITGDMLLIRDTKGRNYYLLPRDFSAHLVYPCNQKGVDCTPILKESAVPAAPQTTGKQTDWNEPKNGSPQPKIKLIKPFSPDKN